MRLRLLLLSALVSATVACAGAPHPTPALPASPPPIETHQVIVTPSDAATEPELAARGEKALLEQRWEDAVDAYRLLVSANATPARLPEYLFDLALALEGAQDRAGARDTFLELVRRFPADAKARPSLLRAASLDAYLEDWAALSAIAEMLLARPDLEDLDRLVALGSRGLARIELGDDAGASKDVLDGLELADRMHYGARDVLPVAVAELRFANGEVRRIRSERIPLEPEPGVIPDDFVAKLEERCGGLLDAQTNYAMAVRSIDPHWAAMAGFRVGEMYRTLHQTLMQIPPPASSRTAKQKQIFYAFMHVRYRVLLEKGIKQIEQTIALGERTSDSSNWIQRARAAKEEMLAAQAEEKAEMEKMPFTEAEVNAAMDLLQKKTAAQAPKTASSGR